MSHENDSERTDRIREEQIRDRSIGSSKPYVGASRRKSAASKQSDKPFLVELFEVFLPSGMRDVVVGFAVGLIPAILAAIFLPGAFKLMSLLILVVAVGAGYMLGEAT